MLWSGVQAGKSLDGVTTSLVFLAIAVVFGWDGRYCWGGGATKAASYKVLQVNQSINLDVASLSFNTRCSTFLNMWLFGLKLLSAALIGDLSVSTEVFRVSHL